VDGLTQRLALLVFLAVVLAVAACDGGDAQLRLKRVESPDSLGLSLRELPPATLKSIGLPYGLAVVKVSALAERAGLRIGDVIYGVNQRRIRNAEDFTRLLGEPGQANLGLLVRRGRTDVYVALDPTGMPHPSEGMPKAGRPATIDTLLRT
jgi:membrane-associated protease RseP (regulator of RpoE activity)